MIRVYTAGKLKDAAKWRDLHNQWPHVYFHARWLKHNQIGTPDLKEYAPRFWQEDEEDVRSADVLILWAEPAEHFRGALVEAGMALAFGVRVIVVGDHPDFGTWQYHRGVYRVANLLESKNLLQKMDVENGTEQAK